MVGRRTRRTSRPTRWRRALTGDLAVDLTLVATASMGFNRWRVADYPLSDFLFVAAAAIVLARLLTGRSHTLAPAESRRSSPLVLCGALIMLTAGTLSSFSAWDAFGSIGVVLRLAWLTLVWFWILRSVTTGRDVFDRLLRAWRLGLLVIALVAVTGELGLTNFSVANSEGRETAFFGHPNDLAGFLVAGLPLIILGMPRPSPATRHAWLRRLAAIGLVCFALAASGSMSALAGGVVGLVGTFVVLWMTRDPRRTRRRHPLFTVLVLTTAGLAVVWLSTSDLALVTRISELNEGDSGVNTSVESRGVRNKNVTDRVDELLVVGIGLDVRSRGKVADVVEGETVKDFGVHNMYLKVLLESGLPSLVGLWIIIGTTFIQAWRLMISLRDDPLHPTVAALFGSMITVNAFAMFQPTLFHRYYWMPLVMIGTLWAVRRQELRRTDHTPAVEPGTISPTEVPARP